MTAETIAEAVWTYPTRELAAGSADPPANTLERIAAEVWTYTTRELTGSAESPRAWFYRQNVLNRGRAGARA